MHTVRFTRRLTLGIATTLLVVGTAGAADKAACSGCPPVHPWQLTKADCTPNCGDPVVVATFQTYEACLAARAHYAQLYMMGNTAPLQSTPLWNCSHEPSTGK